MALSESPGRPPQRRSHAPPADQPAVSGHRLRPRPDLQLRSQRVGVSLTDVSPSVSQSARSAHRVWSVSLSAEGQLRLSDPAPSAPRARHCSDASPALGLDSTRGGSARRCQPHDVLPQTERPGASTRGQRSRRAAPPPAPASQPPLPLRPTVLVEARRTAAVELPGFLSRATRNGAMSDSSNHGHGTEWHGMRDIVWNGSISSTSDRESGTETHGMTWNGTDWNGVRVT